ncbi:uncharacterized protein LOC130497118 [Raphanus sativus]|uniref:Uncharacterized protein LOC130497118 n=1 Tax=Raphanus sativus TaxID=3726 RepID=A0A9W3C3C1_RAPSA|nr:uncharacterized protein LOC130497118 [Raphanus sativus]
MFFRETRVTEADIEEIFNQIRDELKKKSDHGEFIISCHIKGIEFTHALCDTRASASILPKVMADHLGLKVEPTKEFFCFVDCSRKIFLGIIRDLEVQIGNALVPVDFHVLDIKLNWNFSLLLGRAFLATVGAVCDLQTDKVCLTLINPKICYDPVKVVKPQTSCKQPPNEAKLVATCYCEVEYETEYSESIDTHTESSIDTANPQSIDQSVITSIDSGDSFHSTSIDSTPMYEADHFSGDYSVGSWETDYYQPTYAMETNEEEHDEDYIRKQK